MNPFPRRSFGNKAPTKAALGELLRSVLLHRRHGKPISRSELQGFARSYKRTEAEVVALAREVGCEVQAA
jgi:hypothetical protein